MNTDDIGGCAVHSGYMEHGWMTWGSSALGDWMCIDVAGCGFEHTQQQPTARRRHAVSPAWYMGKIFFSNAFCCVEVGVT